MARKTGRKLHDGLAAERKRIERKKLALALEAAAEAIAKGIPPDLAYRVLEIDPAAVAEASAFDEDVASALKKVEEAQQEGLNSLVGVVRALHGKAIEGNVRAATYLLNLYEKHPIKPPPRAPIGPIRVIVPRDDDPEGYDYDEEDED